VRDPRSDRAERLRAAGAELVAGDYGDPGSIAAAARGVHGMFALATPFESGIDAEVQQGRALVDAAKAAGVAHFVYSSVASADRDTGIPHFESKRRVEQHLARSGVPFTIVGPTFFRENSLGALDQIAASGVYAMPLAADRPLQTLCRDDLGAFVTHVLEAGQPLLGRRIDVASDELTGPEMAHALARVFGRPVRYVAQGVSDVLSADDDLGLMWRWFNRVGYSADLRKLHHEFRRVPWKTFDEWLRDVTSERPQPAAV
jgi:uncharacterized protein YbjT (DUF2867 family)